MSRSRHPKKVIEEAVRETEEEGWIVEMSRGHAWGLLLCPYHQHGGCRVRVASTPRNADNEAQRIRREVAQCPHQEQSA